MKKITLEVNDELAEKINRLPIERLKGLERAIEVFLNDKRTLSEVMNDMSDYALERGLTPEILDNLLEQE